LSGVFAPKTPLADGNESHTAGMLSKTIGYLERPASPDKKIDFKWWNWFHDKKMQANM